MQEALKNHHYKKIWEKVIMNRHPKAKSLDESLLMEAKHTLHCEVLFRYEDITEIINVEKRDLINVTLLNKAIQNGISEFQILGRPITLEDIINLFTTQETNKGACDVEIRMFTHGETVNLYNINITGYVETGEEPQYHYVGDFLYNITKHLHEQTPESWEKIANLI